MPRRRWAPAVDGGKWVDGVVELRRVEAAADGHRDRVEHPDHLEVQEEHDHVLLREQRGVREARVSERRDHDEARHVLVVAHHPPRRVQRRRPAARALGTHDVRVDDQARLARRVAAVRPVVDDDAVHEECTQHVGHLRFHLQRRLLRVAARQLAHHPKRVGRRLLARLGVGHRRALDHVAFCGAARERRQVELAVGEARERVKCHHLRWHHVLWQLRLAVLQQPKPTRPLLEKRRLGDERHLKKNAGKKEARHARARARARVAFLLSGAAFSPRKIRHTVALAS